VLPTPARRCQVCRRRRCRCRRRPRLRYSTRRPSYSGWCHDAFVKCRSSVQSRAPAQQKPRNDAIICGHVGLIGPSCQPRTTGWGRRMGPNGARRRKTTYPSNRSRRVWRRYGARENETRAPALRQRWTSAWCSRVKMTARRSERKVVDDDEETRAQDGIQIAYAPRGGLPDPAEHGVVLTISALPLLPGTRRCRTRASRDSRR
jgi:hypothetical protein